MTYLLTILLLSFPLLARTASVDCANVADPAGDFEIWNATSTGVRATDRSDIRDASLKVADDGWLYTVTTTASLSVSSKEKGNLLILFDLDGVKENNYWRPTNGRAGSDAYYSIFTTGESADSWDIRRYDYRPETAKWRRTDTRSRFTVRGNVVTLFVPADEMRERPDLHWRAVLTIGGPDWYARDSAPDKTDDPSACGYLPVPPEPDLAAAMSRASTSTVPGAPASFPWASLYAVAGVAAAIAAYSVFERRIRSFMRRTMLRKKT